MKKEVSGKTLYNSRTTSKLVIPNHRHTRSTVILKKSQVQVDSILKDLYSRQEHLSKLWARRISAPTQVYNPVTHSLMDLTGSIRSKPSYVPTPIKKSNRSSSTNMTSSSNSKLKNQYKQHHSPFLTTNGKFFSPMQSEKNFLPSSLFKTQVIAKGKGYKASNIFN